MSHGMNEDQPAYQASSGRRTSAASRGTPPIIEKGQPRCDIGRKKHSPRL